MVYDDPLSRKSLAIQPHWPPEFWFKEYELTTINVEKKLAEFKFDLDEWLNYKQSVPNDGRHRPHRHPKVEYPLTDEELEALEKKHILCSPVLCPKSWEKSEQKYGEFYKRFWWLGLQMGWVEYGYPPIPNIIWEHHGFFLKIYSLLVYEPFIENWGVPPDDFWIKLSYHLEQNNHEMDHRGLILIFKSQGRIFPSPRLYDYEKDPDHQSLFLPANFWK
jgi:hypothetical protein